MFKEGWRSSKQEKKALPVPANELREPNGNRSRVLLQKRSRTFDLLVAAIYGSLALGAATQQQTATEEAPQTVSSVREVPTEALRQQAPAPEHIQITGFERTYGIPDTEMEAMLMETLPPGILEGTPIRDVEVTPETGLMGDDYYTHSSATPGHDPHRAKNFEDAHYQVVEGEGHIVIRTCSADVYATLFHEFGHNRGDRGLDFYTNRMQQGRRLRMAHPDAFVTGNADHPEETPWADMGNEYRSKEDEVLLTMQLRPGESFEDAGTRVLTDRYGVGVPNAEQIAREDVQYYMRVNGGHGYNWETSARDRTARIHRFEVLRQQHELTEVLSLLPDAQLQSGVRTLQQAFVQRLERDTTPYPTSFSPESRAQSQQINTEVATASPQVQAAYQIWKRLILTMTEQSRTQSRHNPNVVQSNPTADDYLPWQGMTANVPFMPLELGSYAKELRVDWGRLTAAEQDQVRAWSTRLLHVVLVDTRSPVRAGAAT